ncbi:uncharacterized protein LOC126740710 isoform X2 [Anthonomus grandis grandis]|uniref:uncharacterized protein LOC126740710 isoform X2 n=1 Tax=Anthonomus grandis grandis TaxID=2921223 RepID=UPI0021663DEA|nr:uncharacterized protein LOC126740710 isoform X2 [Anthonomus grandis grandis]
MSKRKCVVAECHLEDRKANLITYFRFPADPTRCKQWILNCNRPDLLKHSPQELSSGPFFVCSSHFSEENISKKNPKRVFLHSVPTVFPTRTPKNKDEGSPVLPPFKKIKIGQPYVHLTKIPIEETSTYNKGIKSTPEKFNLPKKQTSDVIKQIKGPSNTTIPVVKIPEQKPIKAATPRQVANLNNSMNNIIQIVDVSGKSQPTLIQISGTHSKNITPALVTQITQALNSKTILMPQQIVKPVASPFPQPKQIVVKKPVANIDLTVDDEPISNDKIIPNQSVNKLCVVPQCTQTYPKCHFLAPQDKFLLELWRICLLNSKLASGDSVCDEHFLDLDIFRVESEHKLFLKKHALPAINKKDIHSACIVPFCKNQKHLDSGDNLYPVPFWDALFGNWTKTVAHLKNTDRSNLIKYRICSRHFSKLNSGKHSELMPDKYLPPDIYLDLLKQWKEKPIDSQTSDIDVQYGCAYWQCTLKTKRFYKLPIASIQLCQAWLTLCKRGDILQNSVFEIEKILRKSPGVCYTHYHEILNTLVQSDYLFDEQFSKKPMVGKLPSVTLPRQHIPAAPAETNASAEYTSKYVPSKEYCAYVNCATHVKTQYVKKYKFPVNEKLLQEWSDAAGIDSKDPIKYDFLFICGKHFNLEQYTDRGTLKRNSIPVNHTEYIDPNANSCNAHWLKKQWQTKKKVIDEKVPVVRESNQCSNCDGIGVVYGSDGSESAYCYSCSGSGKIGKATNLITLTEPSTSAKIQETSAEPQLPAKPQFPTKQEVMEFYGEKCCLSHCSSLATTHQLYPFPSCAENYKFLLWIKAVTNCSNIKPVHNDPNHFVSFKKKKICDKHFEEKYFDLINGRRKLKSDAVPTLHLLKEEKDPHVVKDQEIKWESCVAEQDTSRAFIKGHAILKENSIVFQTIEKVLNFGAGCPKKGLNRFPYNVYSLPRGESRLLKEYVAPGHHFQIHTAVVIDDDSDVEAETVDMIYEAMMENNFHKYDDVKKKLRIS